MKELLVSLLVWALVMVGIYFVADWMVSYKYKNCPLPAEKSGFCIEHFEEWKSIGCDRQRFVMYCNQTRNSENILLTLMTLVLDPRQKHSGMTYSD